jgi:hypothetical protein
VPEHIVVRAYQDAPFKWHVFVYALAAGCTSSSPCSTELSASSSSATAHSVSACGAFA